MLGCGVLAVPVRRCARGGGRSRKLGVDCHVEAGGETEQEVLQKVRRARQDRSRHGADPTDLACEATGVGPGRRDRGRISCASLPGLCTLTRQTGNLERNEHLAALRSGNGPGWRAAESGE